MRKQEKNFCMHKMMELAEFNFMFHEATSFRRCEKSFPTQFAILKALLKLFSVFAGSPLEVACFNFWLWLELKNRRKFTKLNRFGCDSRLVGNTKKNNTFHFLFGVEKLSAFWKLISI